MNSDEKTCPDCAEIIKAAAKACKHCGCRFDGGKAAPNPEPKPVVAFDVFHCPSCKKPTTESLGVCRHCQTKFPKPGDDPNQPIEEAGWADKEISKTGCSVILIALVLLGCFLISQCSAANETELSETETQAAASVDGLTQQSETGQRGPSTVEAKIMAEMNLKALMKDGDSAKYKNVFLSRLDGGNLMLCGKVNSKNSFGAFTGFKRFIASPNPDAPTLIEGEESGLGGSVDGAFPQAYSAVCSNPVERF